MQPCCVVTLMHAFLGVFYIFCTMHFLKLIFLVVNISMVHCTSTLFSYILSADRLSNVYLLYRIDSSNCTLAALPRQSGSCCMLGMALENGTIYHDCIESSQGSYQCPLDRFGISFGNCGMASSICIYFILQDLNIIFNLYI